MNLETLFNINVVVFTVSGLLAGGLECDFKDALKWLRSPKLVGPTLLWGWVVGPAIAWLIAQVLPLSVGIAAGLMLVSLAPIPTMTKARSSRSVMLSTVAMAGPEFREQIKRLRTLFWVPGIPAADP